MADYKHSGFDPVYGYVEEIQFKPLSEQCDVTYKEALGAEPEFNEKVEKVSSQPKYPEQGNLTVPECKCLRH